MYSVSLGAGFSISEMLTHMSITQMIVWIFMVIMFIWMAAIFFERMIRLKKAGQQSHDFVQSLKASLGQGNVDKALADAKAYDQSPIANVIKAGLTARATTTGSHDDVVDTVYRAIERSKERETNTLRRGLGSMATIASAAPFVGLLGTVVGIIGAFATMGESVTLEALGPKIGEALYATAFGLIVAIPAAMLFNYFTTRVEGYVVDMNEVSSEFVDHVLKEGRA